MVVTGIQLPKTRRALQSRNMPTTHLSSVTQSSNALLTPSPKYGLTDLIASPASKCAAQRWTLNTVYRVYAGYKREEPRGGLLWREKWDAKHPKPAPTLRSIVPY